MAARKMPALLHGGSCPRASHALLAPVRPPRVSPSMQLAVAGGAAGLLACGEVGDEYLDGDGRRLVTWHLSAPGVPPGPGTPWDTVLHSPCSFTTAGDGALRCLPRDGALQSFPADAPQLFADPACSQRLYRPRSKAARCASPPVALASHGCRAHVHQVTLHDLAAPIFTSESRTCQAASPESLARLSGPSFGLCAASVSPRQIRAERQVTAVHRVGYRHLGLVYDDAAAPRAPGATAYFTLHEVPLTDFPHLALVVE